eukprot:12902568-Prorocentrum_lima.AAC.1
MRAGADARAHTGRRVRCCPLCCGGAACWRGRSAMTACGRARTHQAGGRAVGRTWRGRRPWRWIT